MILVGTPRQMLCAFAFLNSCTQWKWSLWVSTYQDFGRVCSVVQHPDSSVCLPFSTYQDFGRVCSVAQHPDSSVCLPFSTYQYFGRGCSVVWYLQYYWEWVIIISVLSLGKVHEQWSESSRTMWFVPFCRVEWFKFNFWVLAAFLENQANSTFVLDVVQRFSYQFLKPQNWLKLISHIFPFWKDLPNFF